MTQNYDTWNEEEKRDAYFALVARIKELEEELADYKEGVAGMRLAIIDLRDERDRLLSKSEEVKGVSGV